MSVISEMLARLEKKQHNNEHDHRQFIYSNYLENKDTEYKKNVFLATMVFVLLIFFVFAFYILIKIEAKPPLKQNLTPVLPTIQKPQVLPKTELKRQNVNVAAASHAKPPNQPNIKISPTHLSAENKPNLYSKLKPLPLVLSPSQIKKLAQAANPINLTNTFPSIRQNPPTEESYFKKTPISSDNPGQLINANFQTANLLIQQGRIDEGESMLAKILRQQSVFAPAREELVSILIKTDQKQKALKIVQEGLRISPNYVPYLALEAQIFASQHQLIKALKILNQNQPPIDQYPNFYQFRAGLDENLGHYRAAAFIYQQLVQLDPANGLAWAGFAISLDHLGNREAAVFAYQQALSQGIDNPYLAEYSKARLMQLTGSS